MTEAKSKATQAGERFAWVETVALDPRCTALAIRVVVIISSMLNDKGYAWPSYESLALMTGATKKGVMGAVHLLWSLGHLDIEKDPKPGRSRVNIYRPAGVTDTQPVWSAYHKGSPVGDRS